MIGLMIPGGFTGYATAEFEMSYLVVTPSQVVTGERFTVSTDITNVGGAEGTYAAMLILDGITIDKTEVIVGAGATGTLSFTCIAETPGTHNLEINGLATTVTALEPAEFKVVSISVPPEAVAGEATLIEANVTNIGGVEGTYSTELTLGGITIDTTEVIVGAGATGTLSFTCTIETPGTYALELNDLTYTLEVLKPAEFKVLYLTIPAEVVKGETVVIDAGVTNVGEVAGIYASRLIVNGIEVAIKDVEVAPGAIEKISFTMTEEISRTCTVSLGGLTETSKVLEPHEIANYAFQAIQESQCLQYDMTMVINVGVEQAGELVTSRMVYDMVCAIDNEAKPRKAKMILNKMTEEPPQSAEQTTAEMYLAGDTVYIRADAPEEPVGWQSEKALPELWETMLLLREQIIAQRDVLEEVEVNFVGTEEVDGIDCYIFEVMPTEEAFFKAMQKQAQMGQQHSAGPYDLDSLFSAALLQPADTSVRYWVAKDEYYLKRIETALESDLTELGGKYIKIHIDLNIQSPSAPVIVELPPEAESIPSIAPGVPSSILIYEDDFSNPNSGWPRESTEEYECDFEDGEYHILVKAFDMAAWVWNRDLGQLSDFALEIDARVISGSLKSGYGVVFRFKDTDNFYRFLVSGDGFYHVGKSIKGKWRNLGEQWTKSYFITMGYRINHLKVVCKGSQIEVYVNGHHLTTVTDDSFTEGYVGMIVEMPIRNSRVAFYNIKVYSLD